MARPPYRKREHTHPDKETQRPSRSAKKRASTALQKLGEEIARMRPADRLALDLPQELQEALEMHDRIKDHEGKRRQRQYIGRLMRGLDADGIERALRKFQDTETHRIDWIPVARQEMEAILSAREEKVKKLVREFLEDLAIPEQLNDLSGETRQRLLELAQAARQEQQQNNGEHDAKNELFRMMADLLPR